MKPVVINGRDHIYWTQYVDSYTAKPAHWRMGTTMVIDRKHAHLVGQVALIGRNCQGYFDVLYGPISLEGMTDIQHDLTYQVDLPNGAPVIFKKNWLAGD